MQKLPPELKQLKYEYDMLCRTINDLEWERVTIHLGRPAMYRDEIDDLVFRLDNYRDNMSVLLEKVRNTVTRFNHGK